MFTANELMNMVSMIRSWVSWTVVKIRDRVPAQLRTDVMRESWPVDLLTKTV